MGPTLDHHRHQPGSADARARAPDGREVRLLFAEGQQGGRGKEGEITGKPPVDGPFTSNIRHGFVYERAPHVTLKSIANNAEIDVIWERWQATWSRCARS